jgi:O-antigen ligase
MTPSTLAGSAAAPGPFDYARALLLVGFAYSGMLKWVGFPIDSTLLAAGALVIAALPELTLIRLDSRRLVPIYLLLGYLTFYALTAVYSQSEDYWALRVRSVVLDALGLACGYALLRRPERLLAFFRATQLVGLGLTLLVFYLFASGAMERVIWAQDRSDHLYPDYLRLGLVVGEGAVASGFQGGIWGYSAATAGAAAMLLLGGRGAIVALVVTATLGLIAGTVGAGRSRALLLGLLFISGIFVLGTMSFRAAQATAELPLTLQRQVLTWSDGGSEAMESRATVFRTAITVWSRSPWIGTGIGGYGIVANGDDEEDNPHNIVLEVAAETGVIGLILFLPGVACVVKGVICCVRGDKTARTIGCLLIFVVLHYMKSGSFSTARDLYVFSGAVLAAACNMRSQRQPHRLRAPGLPS